MTTSKGYSHSFQYFTGSRSRVLLEPVFLIARPDKNVLYNNDIASSIAIFIDGRVIQKEDSSDDDIVLCLGDFMAFVTGADHPPPLGFLHSPEVDFDNDPGRTLPRASTCCLVIYLSLHVRDYDIFCSKMDEAIVSSDGFGNP